MTEAIDFVSWFWTIVASAQTVPMSIAFLSGVIVTLALFALLGRAPVRFFLPVIRVPGTLIRSLGRLLRRIRLRRGGATAAESATLIERGLFHDTEVDAALRIIDADDEAEIRTHDFREEEGILTRTGTFFRSIRIPASYLPNHLDGQLTSEIADLYVAEAKKFFARPIALIANDKSLYEDAEGAVIVSLFRSVDRRCYYVLNEMRKIINDNARGLIVGFSIILFFWLAFAVAILNRVAAMVEMAETKSQLNWSEPALDNMLRTFSAPSWEWQTQTAWLLLTGLGAVALMIIAQGNGYRQQQQHNSRELRFFLNKYLGRIADRYREVTGNAKQVTVGKEIDSAKLSALAQRWHKIMVWMPFRTFFIECFVRSVMYQINRNCGYYLLIPWGALILLLLATVGSHFQLIGSHPKSFNDPHFVLFYVATALLLLAIVAVYLNRIGSVVLGEELSRLDWLGFEHLDVSSAMDTVVGKYAEDVGFWKSRMRP